MPITIDSRHIIFIAMLTAGWLALAVPVTAQEIVTWGTEPSVTVPAADKQSSGDAPAPVATKEATAEAATETSEETNTADADTTTVAATDTFTDQMTTLSVSPPAPEPQPTFINISTPKSNDIPATANIPSPVASPVPVSAPLPVASPDPRTEDAPGWWLEAALKQRGNYPAFLGVRFAGASRAVIIETPNHKLIVGQPLAYRLWICNDLPQPMTFHLEYAVRKDDVFINLTNTTDFVVRGSETRLVDTFEQSTDSLAPGIYAIDATLRDQAGNLLHHTKETVELTAKEDGSGQQE